MKQLQSITLSFQIQVVESKAPQDSTVKVEVHACVVTVNTGEDEHTKRFGSIGVCGLENLAHKMINKGIKLDSKAVPKVYNLFSGKTKPCDNVPSTAWKASLAMGSSDWDVPFFERDSVEGIEYE
ncbi:uncharacterized protein G2W53_014232 [Senna tora]|uniref:Uncharacterized protein n=1 Tax=Senna tora TaxID=362788 RepID=A0A835C3U1_9FABA|nr:uncharacterized protein G2W53_014232 [Senna tora]